MNRAVPLVCLMLLLAGCVGQDPLSSEPSPSATQADPVTTTAATAQTSTPTSEVTTAPPPQNPFRSDPIRVGYVVADGAKNRSYEQTVKGALTFWNNRSDGSYDANYTFVSDPSEAQILIRFVDEITYCDGYDNSTVGCAPILEKHETAAPSETVRIEDDYALTSTRDIIVHELGHTRGLVHEDGAALPIMNETIDALLIPEQNLENRSYGWNTTEFRVYFDTAGTVSSVEEDDYRQEVREGWEYWVSETDHLEKDISYRFVDSPEAANVVVKIRDHEGVRWEYWALNTDSDDNLEQYENATLYVGERNPDYIDYNTAHALGYLLLNAENESQLPEPFDGDDEFGDVERWTD
ncbi:hypothetical protein ACH9L7_09995 [Haloferax sp. S1W]|uniref:hypothetical protein n=1 Tax=Haloferax sp. S1W TaxID=3377110 RepID=UPI0037CA844A